MGDQSQRTSQEDMADEQFPDLLIPEVPHNRLSGDLCWKQGQVTKMFRCLVTPMHDLSPLRVSTQRGMSRGMSGCANSVNRPTPGMGVAETKHVAGCISLPLDGAFHWKSPPYVHKFSLEPTFDR